MPQKHYHQHGTFHVTTNTQNNLPLCTAAGVPDRLIKHMCNTRGMHGAQLFAFCILPDHVHMLISPGEKGLSAFMHAFKKNSSRDIPNLFWKKGYHDERIHDGKQRGTVLAYIQGNGMKHGLVDEIWKWPWSSLHFEDVLDPMDIWLY